MHFRGHSRRNAPLLPPFVVYYGHRAVLCLICHSLNSYRAENRPVTANRAVFCFLRVCPARRVVSAHLRGDSCPKPSKAGKTWYTGYNKKVPDLEGRLKRRGSYAKTAHQHGSGAEYAADLPARVGFRRRYPPPTQSVTQTRRSLTTTPIQMAATPILTN